VGVRGVEQGESRAPPVDDPARPGDRRDGHGLHRPDRPPDAYRFYPTESDASSRRYTLPIRSTSFEKTWPIPRSCRAYADFEAFGGVGARACLVFPPHTGRRRRPRDASSGSSSISPRGGGPGRDPGGQERADRRSADCGCPTPRAVTSWRTWLPPCTRFAPRSASWRRSSSRACSWSAAQEFALDLSLAPAGITETVKRSRRKSRASTFSSARIGVNVSEREIQRAAGQRPPDVAADAAGAGSQNAGTGTWTTSASAAAPTIRT
jgi:hypothetical protein